jgi:hypothetical protein
MLCLVPLIKIDISEERIATIIKVTGISELGTTLAVASVSSQRVSVATYC